jgi:hypothetical protein
MTDGESMEPFLPGVPHPPEPGTGELGRFVEAFQETIGFVYYTTGMAARIDEVQRIAVEALANLQDSDPPHTEQPTERETATGELRKFRLVVLEMLLSRGVDNFLTYVAELLALVFRSRPETLRSGETIRLDYVLRHAGMDDLIESLAERRVERLAYQGMRELADDLRKSIGFDLFPDAEALVHAISIIEARNLIVHNRAVINKRHIARVPSAASQLGARLDLEFDSVSDDLAFLARAAYSIDERAIRKWNLATSPGDPDAHTSADSGTRQRPEKG